jgi:acetyl-CoA C-acetyltransferase
MSTNDKRPSDILIVAAARTPVGKFNGALSTLRATDLGAAAVKAAVARAAVDPETIYEVIMGNVVTAGVGQAPARQAAIKGGLPHRVGATTINKVCGSGLKAVMLGANSIMAGEGDVIVAGGMESLSNAPYLLPQARQGLRYGHAEMKDAIIQDGLWCAFQDWVMGSAAEFIGKQFEVTRSEMDEFAYRSHERAAAATARGDFIDEITPVEVSSRKGSLTISRDEPIRANFSNGSYELTTDLAQLGKLPPVFAADGQVTAGNAPGLNDGGAAVVLMSRAEAERQGVRPLARIVGYGYTAVDPQWIFAAPARAIPHLLERIGWTLDEVDLIELNEAFAAQALANGVELAQKGYNWDWDKVNVNGGAIALGHPLGATGARLLVTLLYALRTRTLQRGIVALCLGGGEAVALGVEIE